MFLTPAPAIPRGLRFADLRVDPSGRFVVAVRELHHPDREPTNDLVAIATDGSLEICELWSDSDFVSSPRLSPDGTRLVWVAWDHPNMPWDATRLLVAPFADGSLGDVELVGEEDKPSPAPPLSAAREPNVLARTHGENVGLAIDEDAAQAAPPPPPLAIAGCLSSPAQHVDDDAEGACGCAPVALGQLMGDRGGNPLADTDMLYFEC